MAKKSTTRRKRRKKHPEGAVAARLVAPTYDWPDPPMTDTRYLRQCERAETIEEVRAIVARALPTPRGVPG